MDRLPADVLTLRTGKVDRGAALFIDAGIGHLRLRAVDSAGEAVEDRLLPANRDLRALFDEMRLAERFGDGEAARVFITGKLASLVQRALAGGQVFMPAGVAWLAARDLLAASPAAVRTLAMIDVSASGYLLVGVDRSGALRDDLLLPNPRCGAGTGVNVDRVLQKLGIARESVDALLSGYLGEAGRERRQKLATRADRCGVFGSSATISDKNQGIPLDVALATTLKSEVLKTCRKLPARFDKVVLCGRFFRWRFARECALDHLASIGVTDVDVDTENTALLDAMRRLVERHGTAGTAPPDASLAADEADEEYPPFVALKAGLEADGRFLRLREPPPVLPAPELLAGRPMHLAFDVGSTMAKFVLADDDGRPCFVGARGNSGDTVETIKQVFRDLQAQGLAQLSLRSIGITGSARYQVREALSRIYPALSGRIEVLVENYAHARGSIDLARRHVAELKARGVTSLNEDFCVLVDIGGEDTKISTVALREAELFNNAMNVKCSAGTGSLMDTLASLFGIADAGEASRLAFEARRGLAINATCAVFLMENAQKLQARGVPRDEILASANWAIVENMARTLWNQVDLPKNTVLLLHGQTMLSDPLPLAVAQRFEAFHGSPSYALVPPHPGHRACFGLVRSLCQAAPEGAVAIDLAAFVEARFDKRIIQCKGAACDDPEAVCNRTSLKCRGADGRQFTFTLGGCSAINELFARAEQRRHQAAETAAPVPDSYKDLWDFAAARLPTSTDPDRLVIPRSFVVSEWAGFLGRLFGALGLPVHVDAVREADLTAAQPSFNIDSCAPHMGAVGQFRRLAGEPHGMILAPQIERLDTGGTSLGRTCTLNQGGVAVAANLAGVACPQARFHLFHLDLSRLDPDFIASQLGERLGDVFVRYGIAPDGDALRAAASAAIEHHRESRRAVADRAADLIGAAREAGLPVALVVGREYLLNPGIYDSHVRRLLRDKRMAAIPSWVLDVALDEEFGAIYWRNPHQILTLLKAVAERCLHRRLRHPRLATAFAAIEAEEALLPVVQVSTFCCGPDSVTGHLVAEVMRRRPFLLIQSDAVIKELAHLENRVNTYVRQLESGLHGRLSVGGETIRVRALDDLEHRERIDRRRDVIYIPTLADNRVLTSVLRGAGYTCIDNYGGDASLQAVIKRGRRAAGDAVCAPLAAVYGDLQRAMDDFSCRREAGEFADERRLLYFNNKGSGPCRQGQYVEVHKLLTHRQFAAAMPVADGPCGAVPGGDLPRFLVAREAAGYDFGIEDWVLLRFYLGAILQGVLHELLFAGALACRNADEYRRYREDHEALKREVYSALEAYRGPGPAARALLGMLGRLPLLGDLARLGAYRLYDRRLLAPLERFAERWNIGSQGRDVLHVRLSGEVYMRVAQSEDIFRLLLTNLGFGRFRLQGSPVWSYLEYLLEEVADEARNTPGRQAAEVRRTCRRVAVLRFLLRKVLAGPLYRAARVAMPDAAAHSMAIAREVLPTLRPQGELAPYIGEVLHGLREGVDLILNVAPNGCMVSAMAEVLTPRLRHRGGPATGRVQHLFSADGEVNDELLMLAVLKALGPEGYFGGRSRQPASSA